MEESHNQQKNNKMAGGEHPLAIAFLGINQFLRRALASSNLLIKNASDFADGAVGATIKEQLPALRYPHDIITFFPCPATSNFNEFHQLYQKGHSLREISDKTGYPWTTIRDILI